MHTGISFYFMLYVVRAVHAIDSVPLSPPFLSIPQALIMLLPLFGHIRYICCARRAKLLADAMLRDSQRMDDVLRGCLLLDMPMSFPNLAPEVARCVPVAVMNTILEGRGGYMQLLYC